MRLGFVRFIKLLAASLFIQTSWSFFSMQAMGFLFTLYQAFPDRQRRQEIFRAHKGFFNTHPYMASYIIGAVVRAYDRGERSDEIIKFISVAQTSFAAIGDQLFWQAVRPSLLIAAVIVGMKTGTGIMGPLLFLILYNIFHIGHRAVGLWEGYRRGRDVIYLLKARRITLPQQTAECLGALGAGILPFLGPPGSNSLLIVPLTALFLYLLIRRYSPVLIILIILVILSISIIFMT